MSKAQFNKILIANRGEIAVRIIRACREMGIQTAAVYSDADTDALHVKYADEAVHIGPALSRKSYLNIDRIVQAGKDTGADAVHPGYGFLSENADFATACADNQLIFIGPSAECIAASGNKSAARKTLMAAGIAIIPGSEDIISSPQEAFEIAAQVGYPVILKASGGGGGRGMRIAYDQNELADAIAVASGEARAAFGNPDLYLEKYIEKPRHIEFQVLADNHGNVIHLFERECSVQRRYQNLEPDATSVLRMQASKSPFFYDLLSAQCASAAQTRHESLIIRVVAQQCPAGGNQPVDLLVGKRKGGRDTV